MFCLKSTIFCMLFYRKQNRPLLRLQHSWIGDWATGVHVRGLEFFKGSLCQGSPFVTHISFLVCFHWGKLLYWSLCCEKELCYDVNCVSRIFLMFMLFTFYCVGYKPHANSSIICRCCYWDIWCKYKLHTSCKWGEYRNTGNKGCAWGDDCWNKWIFFSNTNCSAVNTGILEFLCFTECNIYESLYPLVTFSLIDIICLLVLQSFFFTMLMFLSAFVFIFLTYSCCLEDRNMGIDPNTNTDYPFWLLCFLKFYTLDWVMAWKLTCICVLYSYRFACACFLMLFLFYCLCSYLHFFLCQIIPGIGLDNGMKAEGYRCSIFQSMFYLFCWNLR